MEAEPLRKFLEWQPQEQEYIISNGILLPRTRLILYGQFKSWKSMLALHTGFCLASGKNWLGSDVNQVSVLYLQIEIPKSLFHKRVKKYALGNKLFPENLWLSSTSYIKLDRDFGYAALESVIRIIKPGVLIIDPVYKVLSGHITDAYDVMKFLDNMDRLMDKYNCAIVLITHTRKPIVAESGVSDRGAEELMGSSYFANWADSAVGIKRLADADIELHFETMRHSEEEIKPRQVHINRNNLKFGLRT